MFAHASPLPRACFLIAVTERKFAARRSVVDFAGGGAELRVSQVVLNFHS